MSARERTVLHQERGWLFCQAETIANHLNGDNITTFFFVATPYKDDTIHGVAVKFQSGEWNLNYGGIERIVRHPEIPASFIPIIESFIIVAEL